MTIELPKYVSKVTYRNRRIGYRFYPPKKYIDVGIAERKTFGANVHVVKRVIEPILKSMQEWDDANRIKRISSTDKVSTLIEHYKIYSNFSDLADTTTRDYLYMFDILTRHSGDCKIDAVNVQKAKGIYDGIRNAHGLHVSSKAIRVARVLFNHALDNLLIESNPFSRVKVKTPQPRRVMWKEDQVKQFLSTAYNNWEWRNIGLICQMGYAWVQRMNDLRLLTWDCVNLRERQVTILQTKRGATVYLPIEDKLHEMLSEQYEDFGFQPYVAPHVHPANGEFYPYSRADVSRVAKKILEAADLPTNMWLSDLRRTGTTEMVENGVPVTSIMQVTGHTTPSSLSPYLKNTLKGATEALKSRG
jgi:integrase